MSMSEPRTGAIHSALPTTHLTQDDGRFRNTRQPFIVSCLRD
jgi:hypothetical protein